MDENFSGGIDEGRAGSDGVGLIVELVKVGTAAIMDVEEVFADLAVEVEIVESSCDMEECGPLVSRDDTATVEVGILVSVFMRRELIAVD